MDAKRMRCNLEAVMLQIMAESRSTPRLRDLLVEEFINDPSLMPVVVDRLDGNGYWLELRHDPLAVTAASFCYSTLKPQRFPETTVYDVPPLDSWFDERYASFPAKRALPPVLTLSSSPSPAELLQCLSSLSIDRLVDVAQKAIELRHPPAEKETYPCGPAKASLLDACVRRHARPRLEPKVAVEGQKRKKRARI